jgi:hypothetical protein
MKCLSCSANYDDSFGFCPYCGTSKPQVPTVRVQVEAPRYEYCWVHNKAEPQSFLGSMFATSATYYYVAEGIGGNSGQVYAKSERFRAKIGADYYDSDWRKHYAAVCQQLESDGWEPVGKEDKYRRQVNR